MSNSETARFEVGREVRDGRFVRQQSRFREWVTNDLHATFPVEGGRYHLYVSLACPWCHRTVIVRELCGLSDTVPMHYAAPYRDARGWAFTGERFADGPGGEYSDPLNGWEFAAEAYDATDPAYDGRVSLPVLWDSSTGQIVNNESADIIRMFETAGSLGALGGGDDLWPEELREEIDAVNERVYEAINNGVYAAGFARSQGAYDRAVAEVFAGLDWIEALLRERRYLAGDRITEADWRLFPTLVRFDEVYNLHFRCNRRRLIDYPRLWAYARELHQRPGIAQTVAMPQIKRHYYTTHDELNPKRIIPVGPAADWSQPHGRGQDTAAGDSTL